MTIRVETEISSGSIVIHSSKFKSDFTTSSRQIDNIDWLLDLNVFPNPFTERLRIEFVSPEDVNARIDIYDMTGIYVYRLILGDKVESGKVIFKKE
jgi:hypothetical protein